MDFYIRKVKITGLFEQGNNYDIDLVEGCNCIYGSNGTGKTTIINLIVNSLLVDIEALANLPFDSLTIQLAQSGKRRAKSFFCLRKNLTESNLFSNELEFSYEVDGLEEPIQFDLQSRKYSTKRSEKNESKAESLRDYLLKKVRLTHVPLLRLHDSELFSLNGDGDEFLYSALRQRHLPQSKIAEIMDPSVRVLSNLQSQFVEEANENRKLITEKLESLKSRLIEKVMINEEIVNQTSKAFSKASKAIKSKVSDINVDSYVEKLQEAEINVPDEKIKEHFETWRKLNEDVKSAYEEMKELNDDKDASEKRRNEVFSKFNTSYFSLFAMNHFHDRFMSVVSDVEKMQDEKDELTKHFSDYQDEINKYLEGRKLFRLNSDGRFFVKAGERRIKLSELSSGEKHIFSILGKAALSNKQGAIFVADEPELSLHLDWQRMILPSIIKLSPKSQVIVATHSPSIFSKGANEIDLEECVK
ncbi:AAA family ATPase [Paraglaciecola chathamensis]|uniref:AAA family ATPase n=1 Tax=Paraglaciecola chathamensis TaxID=368405 RepID=UPI0027095D95|nr:AAA family ATPase [Paraglaciecola chathamensis]MDO6560597.1 AAA family ATPase [Paraglaciecola chathamensis]